MRKTEDIIKSILDVYNSQAWDEFEEFEAAAHAILSYHGARFKLLDDIKDSVKKSIKDGVLDDFSFLTTSAAQIKWRELIDERCDENLELISLNRYSDSEEGFKEELNKGLYVVSHYCERISNIFHKFITFKSDI